MKKSYFKGFFVLLHLKINIAYELSKTVNTDIQ